MGIFLIFYCLPNWLGFAVSNNISLKSLVYQIFLINLFLPIYVTISSLSSSLFCMLVSS